MPTFLLLIGLLLGEPPRKLYIVYDDSNESKFLYSELTRDWLSKGVNQASLDMNNIQASLRTEIELIYRYENQKYRFISVGYPCYFYGEYGTPERFPSQGFNEVSYPLRTTQSILSEYTTDLNKWKSECENIRELDEWNHYLALKEYLKKNLPDEANPIINCNDPELDCWIPWMDIYAQLVERFGYYDGIPQFIESELPESPVIKRPWE